MTRKPVPVAQPQSLTIQQALQRANEHWNAGQAEQAELLCQRVLAAWPGQPDALHILGLMAHAFGNHGLAIQHLRQACLSPRAPALYFSNLAEMCRQQGLLAEAEEAGRRATALEPTLVSAWNNLGIVLQEAGKFEESVTCLERVVRLQPDSAEAHNNLANTYNRLGELEKARLHYARALAIRPGYAEAESNIAFLLNELGQLDEAAEAARRAIEFNPRLPDAYINLAGVELSRLRYADALRWLDALLSFAPAHFGALVAQARLLKRVDRMEAALEAARRAVASAPQSSDTHNVLGEMLQAANRHDEAIAAFDKAATIPGRARESAIANKASLHMELGAKQQALELFDALLQENPRNISAWANRTELKRFSKGDPDIAQMEALLGPEGRQPINDRIAIHFALGKAYMDAGDGDLAFTHLDAGNRRKRSTFSYNGAETGTWMRGISETFSPALLQKFAGAGHASDMPIFILGMPRSGTTLIEQILASHPAVHGAGELPFMESLASATGAYPKTAETLDSGQIAALGSAYMDRITPLSLGRRHVVDKMPANFLHAGLIHAILPNARIIHTRRDPVDTCLSCYTKLFAAEQRFTYDLTELGQFYRHYEALMDHWRAVLPASHFIEVDYQEMVADQEGQSRRLLEALGLPWDDRCLAFHETNRPVRTASMTQVRQPIYKTSAGRWKAYAAHLQPLLDALGQPQ